MTRKKGGGRESGSKMDIPAIECSSCGKRKKDLYPFPDGSGFVCEECLDEEGVLDPFPITKERLE